MDILGGYGSDSASDGADDALDAVLVDDSNPADLNRREGTAAGVPASEDGLGGREAFQFQKSSGEPNGGHTAVAAGLGSLPAPKPRPRRPAKFMLPILVAPDSDSEEDRPRKKAKSTSKGISLSDYLPAPTNDIKPAKEVPLLGAGVMQGGSRSMRMGNDSDEEMTGTDPYREEMVLGEANEAYRVFDDPQDLPSASTGTHYAGPATEPYAEYQREEGHQMHNTAGDTLLAQALQEEAAKALKDGAVQNPLSGIQFKEINQQKLTYMPPEQKQAKNALRTAFGADHEARVREEAGPKPEKKARSKHQITSLFHQAKMKEMEFIEMKGQAVKTRRETQAKYGWS